MLSWINENWHKLGVLVLLMKEYKIVVRIWEYVKRVYYYLFKSGEQPPVVNEQPPGVKVYTEEEIIELEKNEVVGVVLSTKEGREWLIKKAKETKTLGKLKRAMKNV